MEPFLPRSRAGAQAPFPSRTSAVLLQPNRLWGKGSAAGWLSGMGGRGGEEQAQLGHRGPPPPSARARPRLHPPPGQWRSVWGLQVLSSHMGTQARGTQDSPVYRAPGGLLAAPEKLALCVPGAPSRQECWGEAVPSQPLQPAWGPASALVCAQPGAQAQFHLKKKNPLSVGLPFPYPAAGGVHLHRPRPPQIGATFPSLTPCHTCTCLPGDSQGPTVRCEEDTCNTTCSPVSPPGHTQPWAGTRRRRGRGCRGGRWALRV